MFCVHLSAIIFDCPVPTEGSKILSCFSPSAQLWEQSGGSYSNATDSWTNQAAAGPAIVPGWHHLGSNGYCNSWDIHGPSHKPSQVDSWPLQQKQDQGGLRNRQSHSSRRHLLDLKTSNSLRVQVRLRLQGLLGEDRLHLYSLSGRRKDFSTMRLNPEVISQLSDEVSAAIEQVGKLLTEPLHRSGLSRSRT